MQIVTSKNQDTPLSAIMIPLLTIDLWEHAYYLKHYNLRANYIDNWFQVVNWQLVWQRFQKRKFDSMKREYILPHRKL